MSWGSKFDFKNLPTVENLVGLLPISSSWKLHKNTGNKLLILLNKVPRVSRVPECLSAQVPESLKCPCSQVPWVLECPSALRVPWVSWEPNCSSIASSVRLPECLECLECLRCSSVRVPWKPKCLSKSVSQSASQSDGLQCWFSEERSNFATEETWFNFQQ